MPQPIQYSGEHVDMSPRFFFSQAVAASPAAASETTICTLTVSGDLAVVKGVLLEGTFSITIGTSGVSLTAKIRRTDTSGTVIFTTGANTVTAASLYTFSVQGVDAAAASASQVYVLTATIGSGAASSTVSAAVLTATVF